MNIGSKGLNRYGNLISAIHSQTLPKPDVKVGDDATILHGRDREPARVVGIERNKKGGVAAYLLQAYRWTMNPKGEGHAEAIHWDRPAGEPQRHEVLVRGKLKGTVKDALIGRADAFYDRSF